MELNINNIYNIINLHKMTSMPRHAENEICPSYSFLLGCCLRCEPFGRSNQHPTASLFIYIQLFLRILFGTYFATQYTHYKGIFLLILHSLLILLQMFSLCAESCLQCVVRVWKGNSGLNLFIKKKKKGILWWHPLIADFHFSLVGLECYPWEKQGLLYNAFTFCSNHKVCHLLTVCQHDISH